MYRAGDGLDGSALGMTDAKRLVVIGNGMAGMRTVEELLKHESGQRYSITVFGAEPHVNYNRIMLSSVLAGDKSLDEIVINARDWYDGNGIRLVAGDAVTQIDRTAKTVTAASGLTVKAVKAAQVAAGD